MYSKVIKIVFGDFICRIFFDIFFWRVICLVIDSFFFFLIRLKEIGRYAV